MDIKEFTFTGFIKIDWSEDFINAVLPAVFFNKIIL